MKKAKIVLGILMIIVGILIISYQFFPQKILIYCICLGIVLCGVDIIAGNILKKK